MTRDITTAFKNEIISDSITPIILVQAFFDSETLRFWNGYGQLSYNSNMYTGAGHLIGISKIDETTLLEARGVNISLSGIPSSLLSVALSEEYQGRKVTIDWALLDSSDNIISDPYRFFSGKADVITIKDGADTATLSLAAENDLIVLKRINERRRTPEDQKIKHPGDTFFDNVVALQSKAIRWGG